MSSLATSAVRAKATKMSLSGEVFGTLINLSGRRRFTSQRAVLYAVLASLGHEDAATTALDALALFRNAHTDLVEGNDALPGIFCNSLQEAYFGRLQGDNHIREFISLAERTIDAITAGRRAAPSLLSQLTSSTTPLLKVLNHLTQVYEEEAKRHALQMKKQQQQLMNDIQGISKQARMVAFNAQIIAARAGASGKEFAVVANELSSITSEIEELVQVAMANTAR